MTSVPRRDYLAMCLEVEVFQPVAFHLDLLPAVGDWVTAFVEDLLELVELRVQV